MEEGFANLVLQYSFWINNNLILHNYWKAEKTDDEKRLSILETL